MQLTQKVGETSHLAVWDRGTTVRFVDKVLSRSTIRTDSEIGFGREAHLLACGKTLLAWQSPDFQDSYMSMADFTPLTPHTITSPERLRQELAQIRAEGYGTDLQESELGLVCFAAPIRDRTGRVAAAVSISGPAQRMLDNRDLNVAAVRAAAEQISAAIG